MTTQAEIDILAAKEIPSQRLLIEGTWVEGEGEALPVHSPIDGGN